MATNKLLRKMMLFIFLISLTTYSQNNIVSSGGVTSGSGGTSSFSVGQIAYSQQIGTNGYLIQGMQQPFEIIELSNEDFTAINLKFEVFPNPTKANLHLQFSADFDNSNTFYELFDINGKRITNKIKASHKDVIIPMEQIPSGIYLLYVSKDNALLKSFKIIKNN